MRSPGGFRQRSAVFAAMAASAVLLVTTATGGFVALMFGWSPPWSSSEEELRLARKSLEELVESLGRIDWLRDDGGNDLAMAAQGARRAANEVDRASERVARAAESRWRVAGAFCGVLLLTYVLYQVFRSTAREAIANARWCDALALLPEERACSDEWVKMVVQALERVPADPGPLPSALLDTLRKLLGAGGKK